MPRDVFPGEGYDGDVQIHPNAPGYHNGEFWLDDGSGTLLNMGDVPDQGYLGDHNKLDRGEFDRQQWAMGGMGDVAAEWAQLLAKDSLDKLRNALSKVVDQLISMGSYRKTCLAAYSESKAILNETLKLIPKFISSPMVGAIPNPSAIPAMVSFHTSVQAVQFFARMVGQSEQLLIVYKKIEDKLYASGLKTDADMVATGVYQLNKFLLESEAMFRAIPEYEEAHRKLVKMATEERNLLGVGLNDYLDPRWYEAYLKGAEKAIPLPKAAVASASGVGDLSGMEIGPAAIVAIGASIALIAVSIIASLRLFPDSNFQAKAALQLAMEAQKRKAAAEAAGAKLKADTVAQMTAQGKPQSEINAMIESIDVKVEAQKKSIDADTAKNIETLPPPPSFLSGLIGPLGIAAAAIVAGLVLSK